jgi:hypothetical protein
LRRSLHGNWNWNWDRIGNFLDPRGTRYGKWEFYRIMGNIWWIRYTVGYWVVTEAWKWTGER